MYAYLMFFVNCGCVVISQAQVWNRWSRNTDCSNSAHRGEKSLRGKRGSIPEGRGDHPWGSGKTGSTSEPPGKKRLTRDRGCTLLTQAMLGSPADWALLPCKDSARTHLRLGAGVQSGLLLLTSDNESCLSNGKQDRVLSHINIWEIWAICLLTIQKGCIYFTKNRLVQFSHLKQ